MTSNAVRFVRYQSVTLINRGQGELLLRHLPSLHMRILNDVGEPVKCFIRQAPRLTLGEEDSDEDVENVDLLYGRVRTVHTKKMAKV